MTSSDGSTAEYAASPEPSASRELTGHEIVVRLLELTPEPPTGFEHDPLIAAFEAIVAARDEVIALLGPPISLGEADRTLLIELERRQTLWHEALAGAQRTIGGQRCGAEQLRAYARTL